MSTDADAAAREWTAKVHRDKFILDVGRLSGELETLIHHARVALAEPMMDHEDLAAVRARLLRALLDGGAVVLDQADRRGTP